MTRSTLIYLIEDDSDIVTLVTQELERFGHQVKAFRTGSQAEVALRQQQPDVCIVDLGLPDMDGLSLVRDLTSRDRIGVMILSGRDSLPDRVLGLELGADDYVSKPFDPRELVARINSIIRRLNKSTRQTHRAPDADAAHQQACFDRWVYQPATLTLRCDQDEETVLSAGEAELLMQLLRHPKVILSREQLLRDQDEAFDRSIDVRMSRIRKKIEQNPRSPRLIKTIYGMGYMLTTDVEWSQGKT